MAISVKAIPPDRIERRLAARGMAIRIFAFCWLVYVLHFATNIVREIFPALSLGDHLSFDVSEYQGLHSDIFRVEGRGAFINNNPGASMLGAIPYALTRPVIERVVEHVQRYRTEGAGMVPEYKTIYPLAREFYRKARERGLDVKFGLGAGVMQAFLMAPISALSVVVMLYILISVTSSVRTATLLSLLYAFATPVFYRSAHLNQNLLISHCALFAFALLWRPWDDPLHLRRPQYLWAGLLCGWAVVLDYSGVIVPLILGFYGLFRRLSLPAEAKSRYDLLEFVIGVILCLMVLMGYQWICFGSPFYPAQHYMPGTEFSHYGYQGMDWPHLDLLWETTFGIRYGLFTFSPLLLLALYIPDWFRSYSRLVDKRELWCILLFTAAFFLFCAMNQHGRLQYNTGVRYIVPVTPFLFLLAAGVLVRMPAILAVFMGITTTYWSWCLAMYRDVEQGFGVFEAIINITRDGLRLPWLTTLERMGYVSREASMIAFLVLVGALVWMLWGVKKEGMRSLGYSKSKIRQTLSKGLEKGLSNGK